MLPWLHARQIHISAFCGGAYLLAIIESLVWATGNRTEAALTTAVMAPLGFILLYVVLGFHLVFNPLFRGWVRSRTCAFVFLAGGAFAVAALVLYPINAGTGGNTEAAFFVGAAFTAYHIWRRYAAPHPAARA